MSVQRLSLENVPHLLRTDPFNIHDYHVDYSLNKKKRWTIPDEIGEKIEDVQVKYKWVKMMKNGNVQGSSPKPTRLSFRPWW